MSARTARLAVDGLGPRFSAHASFPGWIGRLDPTLRERRTYLRRRARSQRLANPARPVSIPPPSAPSEGCRPAAYGARWRESPWTLPSEKHREPLPAGRQAAGPPTPGLRAPPLRRFARTSVGATERSRSCGTPTRRRWLRQSRNWGLSVHYRRDRQITRQAAARKAACRQQSPRCLDRIPSWPHRLTARDREICSTGRVKCATLY